MSERLPIFADTYSRADACQQLGAQLIATAEPFAHCYGARLVWLWSERELFLRGARCTAFIAVPRVQGPLGGLFEWGLAELARPLMEGVTPDFVILVDRALFQALDAEGQERVVFHELKHIAQKETSEGLPAFDDETGLPKLKLVPHDTEVFDDEVRRYGVQTCQLESHALALADGIAAEKARRVREGR